jgi:hypothetical protein
VRPRPGRSWVALCGIFVAAVAGTTPAAGAELGLSSRTVSARGNIAVSFELTRPATVVFSITQTAPVCRKVGAFQVRGQAGGNRFLFPGRVDRRLLRPGTYRLAGTIDRSRAVGPTFVVAGGRRSAEALNRALRRDVCARRRAADGQTVATVSPPRPQHDWLRSLVIGCLLLAIPLLAVAALPRGATPGLRSAELLAARRPAVAAAGGAALLVAVVLYGASLV